MFHAIASGVSCLLFSSWCCRGHGSSVLLRSSASKEFRSSCSSLSARLRALFRPAALGLNRLPAEKTEWHGKVVDESGLPIEGIAVEVIDAEGRSLLETQSDQEGKFSFATAAAGKLRVRHPDFDPVEQAVGLSSEALIVTLRPVTVRETMTITATRTPQPVEGVPAAVVVMSQKDLQQSPAVTLDDTLRQVPAFSLFRRTSSLVAHPTTQGVSLRGIGPSGVSRTLGALGRNSAQRSLWWVGLLEPTRQEQFGAG